MSSESHQQTPPLITVEPSPIKKDPHLLPSEPPTNVPSSIPADTESKEGTLTEEHDVHASLDNAKLSLFHFKTIVIAGMGFFTDAYDLFAIGLLTKLLAHIYYDGSMPLDVTAALSSVALCGTLAGQLFFGWAGDEYGRKKVYGYTLLIMIGAALCSGLSFGSSKKGVIATLAFFRFILGFGVGGDYPLSATIMSEYSSKSHRGAFVAAVFAMQGTGILMAATVTIVITAIFQTAEETPENADYVWRIVLMLAAVPTAATMYYRNKMPETLRYTLNVAKNAEKAQRDMGRVLGKDVKATKKVREFSWGTFFAEFKWKLLGCGMTWFLLDIAFYSQNLFQSDVFKTIGWVPDVKIYWPSVGSEFHDISGLHICNTTTYLMNTGAKNVTVFHGLAKCAESLRGCDDKAAGCWMSPLDQTYLIARAQAIIALASTVPGYWFTVFTIEHMGRFWIQMMGFFMMTVFMAFLAGFYDYFLEHVGGFVAMYAFTFFFANWGPNSTTFVLPAEVFPSRFRSTAHGISAAAGKAGAIIGAFGFLYASKDPSNPSDKATYGDVGIGLKWSLGVLAIINFVGMLFTFLVPETKGHSLEALGAEHELDDVPAEGDASAVNEPTAEAPTA